MPIEAISVGKAFGGVVALSDASFSAEEGEVHALVGENGAGKSTLIKILSGLVRPDKGTTRVNGETVRIDGPAAARRLGIGTAFQELSLLPNMTVADNLLLRSEPRNRLRLLSRRKKVREARYELDRVELDGIDPDAVVATLGLEQQQLVEIAKVILRQPKILLLDEATSALGAEAVQWLFGIIRRLRNDGRAVVFTSHRWKEVVAVSDRMTIFRNGEDVETSPASAVDEERAIEVMTGRKVQALFPTLPRALSSEPVLQGNNLTAGRVRGVSFALHRGEILGVGGLAGQGQLDLFAALFGALRRKSGEIAIKGRRVTLGNPSDAIKHGIAFVPEDRKREGLILPMSVRENMTFPILGRLSTLGYVDRRQEQQETGEIIKRLAIRTPGGNQPVGMLSGGSQQKVLLGRWLLADADILLFYDVTRGVDVATKHDIYDLMLRFSAEGRALLFYSSDTDEVAHLCHRVMVLREGRVAAELGGDELTSDALVRASLHIDGRLRGATGPSEGTATPNSLYGG